MLTTRAAVRQTFSHDFRDSSSGALSSTPLGNGPRPAAATCSHETKAHGECPPGRRRRRGGVQRRVFVGLVGTRRWQRRRVCLGGKHHPGHRGRVVEQWRRRRNGRPDGHRWRQCQRRRDGKWRAIEQRGQPGLGRQDCFRWAKRPWNGRGRPDGRRHRLGRRSGRSRFGRPRRRRGIGDRRGRRSRDDRHGWKRRDAGGQRWIFRVGWLDDPGRDAPHGLELVEHVRL